MKEIVRLISKCQELHVPDVPLIRENSVILKNIFLFSKNAFYLLLQRWWFFFLIHKDTFARFGHPKQDEQ
jgi:hypothetical protein